MGCGRGSPALPSRSEKIRREGSSLSGFLLLPQASTHLNCRLINMTEGVAPERRGGDPPGVTRQSAGATPQSLGVPQSRVAATVDA